MESREELLEEKEKEKDDDSSRRERKSTAKAKENAQAEVRIQSLRDTNLENCRQTPKKTIHLFFYIILIFLYFKYPLINYTLAMVCFSQDERPQRVGSREVKREVKGVRKDDKGATPGSGSAAGTAEGVRSLSGAVPLDIVTPKAKAVKKAASGSPAAPQDGGAQSGARRARSAHKKGDKRPDDPGAPDDDSADDGDDDSEKGDKVSPPRGMSRVEFSTSCVLSSVVKS